MSGEMLERVAHVIREFHTGTDEQLAKAIIFAMREPTKAMLDTGSNEWPERAGANETHPWERGTWRAMIDEALKEPVDA